MNETKVPEGCYTCPRCNGTRYFKVWSHVKGGVCFLCGGLGYRTRKRAPKLEPAAEVK